jgi:hypothetical protein
MRREKQNQPGWQQDYEIEIIDDSSDDEVIAWSVANTNNEVEVVAMNPAPPPVQRAPRSVEDASQHSNSIPSPLASSHKNSSPVSKTKPLSPVARRRSLPPAAKSASSPVVARRTSVASTRARLDSPPLSPQSPPSLRNNNNNNMASNSFADISAAQAALLEKRRAKAAASTNPQQQDQTTYALDSLRIASCIRKEKAASPVKSSPESHRVTAEYATKTATQPMEIDDRAFVSLMSEDEDDESCQTQEIDSDGDDNRKPKARNDNFTSGSKRRFDHSASSYSLDNDDDDSDESFCYIVDRPKVGSAAAAPFGKQRCIGGSSYDSAISVGSSSDDDDDETVGATNGSLNRSPFAPLTCSGVAQNSVAEEDLDEKEFLEREAIIQAQRKRRALRFPECRQTTPPRRSQQDEEDYDRLNAEVSKEMRRLMVAISPLSRSRRRRNSPGRSLARNALPSPPCPPRLLVAPKLGRSTRALLGDLAEMKQVSEKPPSILKKGPPRWERSAAAPLLSPRNSDGVTGAQAAMNPNAESTATSLSTLNDKNDVATAVGTFNTADPKQALTAAARTIMGDGIATRPVQRLKQASAGTSSLSNATLPPCSLTGTEAVDERQTSTVPSTVANSVLSHGPSLPGETDGGIKRSLETESLDGRSEQSIERDCSTRFVDSDDSDSALLSGDGPGPDEQSGLLGLVPVNRELERGKTTFLVNSRRRVSPVEERKQYAGIVFKDDEEFSTSHQVACHHIDCHDRNDDPVLPAWMSKKSVNRKTGLPSWEFTVHGGDDCKFCRPFSLACVLKMLILCSSFTFQKLCCILFGLLLRNRMSRAPAMERS